MPGRELDDAKQELLDGRKELDDAKQELLDARQELDDGWKEYNDGLAELADGRRVSLRGSIDRVDVAKGSDAAFVRIIDYKMQNKTLRLSDIYYGLNWQLPLYLEALLRNAKEGEQLRPAGMFYVPVQEIVKMCASWMRPARR